MAGTVRAAALHAYLPRVASEWSSVAPDRSWQAVDGTLVFADVSGFTALSERLAKRGPVGGEELTEVLGRCFADLLGLAYAEGGSLLKFGGDALLLLFDGPGHAERGARAAMRMRTGMVTIGKLSTSVGKVRLRMSLGVHTGELHLFSVGASHKELVITGPGASTTVAMEAAAGAGEIVVSPATARALDPSLLSVAKGPGVLLRNRQIEEASATFPVRRRRDDPAGWIPDALRVHLARGGADSEHRHAAVAFVHFDGTDHLLATDGPAAVAAALDELVCDVQRAVEAHGVTFLGSDIDRDGGKVILVAGAPTALGDDDGRLLRAVRQIVEGQRRLPVRIGVNRGPVFAGEIGPPYRRTYTVMGDAVNLAARLMAAADSGEVLASAPVLSSSRTAFDTVELPPFPVKGKAEPVLAFVVGPARGAHDTRAADRLPLTGRDQEVAALLERVEAARRGDGGLVDIVGDVGVGKSRLVRELRTRATDVEHRLISCEQYEASTPFFAFRLLLRALLQITAHGDEGLRQLRAQVRKSAPAVEPWLPLIADVLDLPCDDTPETAVLDERFRRGRTNTAVCELLAAAVARPAVLGFEDVHWMDDASAAMLGQLVLAAEHRPWVVVTTRRSDPTGYQPAPGLARLELSLTALDERTTVALVDAATRDAPLPPHRRDALVRRSGGNPLFLEELLAVFADEADGALPESLEAVVAWQLDRLPVEDRRLIRVASVLGTSFEVPVLAAVLGTGPRQLARALQSVDKVLVREHDGRIAFRHRLFRDVAYQALPFRRRQELHCAAATFIERQLGESAEEAAEILSLHFQRAADHPRCWRYAFVAAQRAKGKYANLEAVRLFERATGAARHVEGLPYEELAAAWSGLADVATRIGLYDRARSALREARRLAAGDPAELLKLCYREAHLADRQGRALSSVRWVRRGLREAAILGDSIEVPERADLRVLYAWTRQRSGKHAEAIDICRAAVAEAEATDNRTALASAYMLLDYAHIDLGQPELATHADKALEIFEDLGKFWDVAILFNNRGAFAYYQGRWAEALDYYAKAREAFERIGDAVDAALGSCNIAEIFADQGRLDDAEEVLVEVVQVWRSMRFPLGLAMATRHLARVALRRGDAGRARQLFGESRESFAAFGMAAKVIEVDAWIAECMLRSGDVAGAAAVVDDAIAREEAAGTTEMAPMLHRLRGYAAAAEGRFVDAWAAFDTSLDIARRRAAAFDVALALEALSVVAALGGPSAGDDVDEERAALLAQLGVHATPPPPLVAAGAAMAATG